MATWKPEKTMITNKGLLMISEAQIGNEPLIITRAEIGSTFSQTAQLPDLLSIPSPAYSPTIGDRMTTPEHSLITLSVDNIATTVPYNICQIGIYATHPNIDEGVERLYYIAQCESPPDKMPSGETDPLRVSYKVHLKHDQANNVVINVVDNFLPTASTQTLGAIRVGENLEITEDGYLNAKKSSGVIVSETEPLDLEVGNFWYEIVV